MAFEDFYCYSRGEFLVALTNQHSKIDIPVSGLPFPEGSIICNVFNIQDCLIVGSGNMAIITLVDAESKIYVPKKNEEDIGAVASPLRIPMEILNFLTNDQ